MRRWAVTDGTWWLAWESGGLVSDPADAWVGSLSEATTRMRNDMVGGWRFRVTEVNRELTDLLERAEEDRRLLDERITRLRRQIDEEVPA